MLLLEKVVVPFFREIFLFQEEPAVFEESVDVFGEVVENERRGGRGLKRKLD